MRHNTRTRHPAFSLSGRFVVFTSARRGFARAYEVEIQEDKT